MKRAFSFFSSLLILVSAGAGTEAPAQVTASDRLNAETFRGLELRNLCPAVTPARVADIAVNPTNGSIWYVATAASGLWKTSNRGSTWQTVFDEGGSYSLGCVTIDPKHPDVVWLGTGENQSLRSVSYGDGVYKSTDAGATWKKVGLPNSEHIAKILVHPKNSDIVFVAAQGPLWAPGGDRGLYQTKDGGKTWKAVLQISENTGITDVVFDPKDPDILYAAAYQRRRNVGLLIGGGPEAGIFKSTDGGVKWKKITNGLPDVDLGRIALAVSPQKPNVVYAAVTAANRQSGFYRSDDRGEKWTRQRDYQMVDPQYYGELYPDPFQFDRVYLIDSTIQMTADGGKTINPVRWQIHVDNHALVFDPADENHLLVGNDGGLYETYDNGRNWRHFDNMPMQQFYGVAVDNATPFYHVYGGAQDNGSLGGPSRSINRAGIRNSDWNIVGGGDGMQPRVDPADPNILYIQSQNGAINRLDLRTSASTGIRPRADGPVRWNWNAPVITSAHAAGRIYMAGSRLFRSDDRGANWKTISPDLTRQINRDTLPVMGRLWGTNAVTKNLFTTDLGVSTALAESPKQEGLLYVGTDDGLVQVSEDGGANWRKVEQFSGVPEQSLVSDVCPSPNDPDTVYAAFNDYQRGNFKPYLLKSVNRGKDWTSIAGNLPSNYPVWCIVEDTVNRNLLFAGTEFGLFFSIDAGKQWVQLRGGVATAAFRDLEIQQRETDLVCATFGRGFYVLDDFTPLRQLTPAMLEKETVLLPLRRAQTYNEFTFARASWGNMTMPNPPFGATFTYYLRDDLSKDNTRIALEVADAGGKTVRQVTGPATAGLHRVTWNLRGEGGAAPRGGGEELGEEAEEAEEEEPGTVSAEAQELQQAGGGEARGVRGDAAAGARGGGQRRGGRGGGGNAGGNLVAPGQYKVTLGKLVDGKLVPLDGPQTFQVVPLEASAAQPAK